VSTITRDTNVSSRSREQRKRKPNMIVLTASSRGESHQQVSTANSWVYFYLATERDQYGTDIPVVITATIDGTDKEIRPPQH
jgi:hypothetical protein